MKWYSDQYSDQVQLILLLGFPHFCCYAVLQKRPPQNFPNLLFLKNRHFGENQPLHLIMFSQLLLLPVPNLDYDRKI